MAVLRRTKRAMCGAKLIEQKRPEQKRPEELFVALKFNLHPWLALTQNGAKNFSKKQNLTMDFIFFLRTHF